MDKIGKRDNNRFIGLVMDRKSGGQMSVSKIEFQKKRSNQEIGQEGWNAKVKQIEFRQNKLSTGGFNASKDLNPELRI